MAPQQLAGLLEVSGDHRVLDGGVDIAMLLVPRACAGVKLGLAPRVEPGYRGRAAAWARFAPPQRGGTGPRDGETAPGAEEAFERGVYGLPA